MDEREDHTSEVNIGHTDTSYRDELLGELSRLIDVTARSSRRARQTAVKWRRAHYLLGLPAAVLAAMAAFTGLAATSGRVPAALLALAASGLGAAGTFLAAQARADANQKLWAAYSSSSSDARILRLESHRHQPEVLSDQLKGLLDRREALIRKDFDEDRRLR